MTPDVTLESFLPHVGHAFAVRSLDGGAAPTLTLAEAKQVAGDDDERRRGRQPFTLIFRMNARDRMAQGTYVIEHEGFVVPDVFLVPILPDSAGMRVQAIFA